ncbi:hypothetical protein JOQ06_026144 [Pogonophryne albipinna]|uniref:Uncharacterized protein n=1 Tax=Pogonophryne albipinna TaxID=1090488 RepID=A0AAD6F3E2_9TELE|nr:hypothetical protein JOQ06_026144 [Pogonophryne albipinna]
MELTTLCTVLATLRVLPNKSQFFKYESVSFSSAVHQESPAPPPPVLVLFPVFGVFLALGSLMLLGLWRNHKGEDEADVDYTNVTVTQEGPPIRIRDADTASTYSTVRT